MTKKGSFKKVRFILSNTSSYGRYILRAIYYKKVVSVAITDAEVWDWLDDDSDRQKHEEARRACYYAIKYANY